MPQLTASPSTISGSSLLQTEQILFRKAPELIPFIRQIRSRGEVSVHSVEADRPSSFSVYVVDLPKEACRLILGVTQRMETECKGHPAFTRELVRIWTRLAEQAS